MANLTGLGLLAAVVLAAPTALVAPATAVPGTADTTSTRGAKAAVPGRVVVPGGKESSLTLGGLLQVQAEFGEKGDARFASSHDRFYLRRARVSLAGRFSEGIDGRLELDLAGSLGENSGVRAQLTDGYVHWNRHAAGTLRAGQFKTPFGYEQLYADPKLLVIERSLANDRLTPGRQVGAQVSGDLLKKRLGYASGVFNGTGVNASGNDDDHFLFVERLSGVLLPGAKEGDPARWTAGVSAFAAREGALAGQPPEFGFDAAPGAPADNVFSGRRRAVEVDTQVRASRFEVWAEYLSTRFEPWNRVPARIVNARGGYVLAAVMAIPERLQVVARWDGFDPGFDPVGYATGNSTRTWTAGTTVFLRGDDLKIQANVLRVEDGLRRDEGSGGEAETDTRLLLRLQAVL
jgi:hypothetical protein